MRRDLIAKVTRRSADCFVPVWVLAALSMTWSICQLWYSEMVKAEESHFCQSLIPPRSLTMEDDLFRNALEDTKSIEECEHWGGLEVISQSNPNIIWDSTGNKVLMVTWVASKPIETNASFKEPIWATPVPAIHSMLRREVYKLVADSLQKDPARRELQLDVLSRTRKYLGLRPKDKPLFFLEFWVSPKSLVRPCEDREVTDSRCTSRKRPAEFTDEKYPFTGLGYTYDWGNRMTEIGSSEFQVVAGESIRIFQVLDNRQYLSCDTVEMFPAIGASVRRVCE